MYLQVKKDTKYFNEKSINQSPVRMYDWMGEGGGECFLPQQKNRYSTGVEDSLGKGKYFPKHLQYFFYMYILA